MVIGSTEMVIMIWYAVTISNFIIHSCKNHAVDKGTRERLSGREMKVGVKNYKRLSRRMKDE